MNDSCFFRFVRPSFGSFNRALSSMGDPPDTEKDERKPNVFVVCTAKKFALMKVSSQLPLKTVLVAEFGYGLTVGNAR